MLSVCPISMKLIICPKIWSEDVVDAANIFLRKCLLKIFKAVTKQITKTEKIV